MKRHLKRTAILGVVVILVGVWLVVSRQAPIPNAPPVDPAIVLSATQAQDDGTEPVALPSTPVLKNTASDPNTLAVDFGYKVGTASYAYHLALDFAADAEAGTMAVTVPVAGHEAERFPVERHFSDSRKAYLVAVSHDLAKAVPAVPSLCVRAVIGPSKASLDLKDASLCVMQRDQDGRCHPTTLACGLIR